MLTLFLALTRLAGGEISGDLRSGDQYLADVPMQLKCGAETVEGKTDKAGSFRLRGNSNGKCRLQITWKEQSLAVDVVVFEKPTRYRLVVEEQAGKYILKRV
ncbi:MAG TPA: hypothetical protein VGQ17_02400 [Gemmatimonadales bacterium]|jgi:hypothetical protein|nr:hypothetical protein [Gemmatimonadales bacterium]